jgi:hypothetical protein
MSENEVYEQSSDRSFGIALVLLAVAFNLFLVFNALLYWGGLKNQVRQNDALAQQIAQGKQAAVNARQVQGMLEGLANDILALSASEPEVRRIVEKYQIRRMNAPAAQPAVPQPPPR